jgi:hypothetical protein
VSSLDLSAEHPEVVERLDAERMRLLETTVRSSATTPSVVELSDPERESLEALGYVE